MLGRVVAEVYPAYQERLLASSAVDFDDLLLHVAQLLYDHAEIRAELDERFRYVLVDEYQDTNRAQYVILRALSTDYPNLAVTGDPDQSIYGWRGADLNNILEFEHDYPEREDRAAGAELSQHEANPAHGRRADRPQPAPQEERAVDRERRRRGRAAGRLRRSGPRSGRTSPSRFARRSTSGRRKPSDFAIFYRVNALSRALEKALRAAGVPYQMVRGQEFYARKEIKDVLAYCQLVNNPRDDMAFERTVNTPPRGIGRKTIERLTEHAYRYGMPLLEAARRGVRDRRLVEGRRCEGCRVCRDHRSHRGRRARRRGGGHRHGAGGVGLPRVARRQRRRAGSEPAGQHRGIAHRRPPIRRAESGRRPAGGVSGAHLARERDRRLGHANRQSHADDAARGKGLEFPVVFIVAVEDGVLPHERVGQHPDELEEERRLAFVGITRAKDELQLSYAVTRDFRGVRRRTIPSSFLMEMPRDEMEMVDAAGAFDAAASIRGTNPDDDGGDDSWEDWQIEDVAVEAGGRREVESRRLASSPRRSKRPPRWRAKATAGKLARPKNCRASRPTYSSRA